MGSVTACDIISKLLKYCNLSAKAFSEKIGIERPQAIYDILNGKTKSISRSMSIKILSVFPEIDKAWLLTGEGEMLKEKKEPQPDDDHKDYETYLLPMTAAGGSLVGFDSDGAAAADCEKIISPIAKVSFAITVYGESMYPTYPSGSRVLIKKADPNVFIEWGTVYVLDTLDGIVIKEVHKSKDPNKIICHSINSKYDDFEINMSNVRGWYRVLASINIVHL